ncbi:uncharacterized protein L3040_009235 [Drepanopeziza brunnea f. sp. 'multigermtubi']|uniref:DUF2406 domain protein n=1 Tax=Marssonina brunnea f. sp. multigermtubi (strain MB_m1) TaxID=1072389 RepID=K1Y2E3_MARBU|nr:uncharacterized protein MBM_02561 [Drepanopeziza brunnea f. sp. 'multigermtubi' MB_m1]EKD19324.1 hypothetical protein MBM_02561 [Drepanopeziza brunnea f. sp. 'multigermtubi' MB_m1]KAJ5032639.1 hypothetical protein L3040_009235 [Drepanopeziza brunnea f. sp. 'multigermtubi']
MSSARNYQTPAAAEQQGRPRAKSNFSFHSRKSSGSNGQNRFDLHESHDEKEAKRLQTKADPQMALTEAEPSMVAREQSSLASIRAIQHLDNYGNPIADPDRSNPTRSRWERPLDTIRAFEAAIDGNHSRRSYARTESDRHSTYDRRTSHYGGTQVTTDGRPRNSYGGRSPSHRPDNNADGRINGMTRPDSYYQDRGYTGPANGYQPNYARYPRTASEPHFINNNNHNNHNNGVYPIPGTQPSYETVATVSGSGMSDPEGYLTENSSVDRISPMSAKEPVETYSSYAPPGSGLQEQQHGASGFPPQDRPVPPRKESVRRSPIKLGKSNANVNASPPPSNNPQRPAAEKRRSWFGKRFSKG